MRAKKLGGKRHVSSRVEIGLITGDGIGPEITPVMRSVVEEAVRLQYGARRAIEWRELCIGQCALTKSESRLRPDLIGTKAGGAVSREEILRMESERARKILLPEKELRALKRLGLAIKGPLFTPFSSGFRSLNVGLRQALDLYACVRPIRYLSGTPSPIRHPEGIDIVIFRENTEDVYAGIEYAAGSQAARSYRALARKFHHFIPLDCGIGLKPIGRRGTKRLVRSAFRYAIEHDRKRVTLMHKGNIMKYTEGAFRDWGYEVATGEFRDKVITRDELADIGPDGIKRPGLYAHLRRGAVPGRIVVDDETADSMFQKIILKPRDYDVIVTTNLNGDYLADAAAALVGGVAMVPVVNVNFERDWRIFEAAHGTAPEIAGEDRANPLGLIRSACLMLEYLGWKEAAARIELAILDLLEESSRRAEHGRRPLFLTGDLAAQFEGFSARDGVRTSQFQRILLARIREVKE